MPRAVAVVALRPLRARTCPRGMQQQPQQHQGESFVFFLRLGTMGIIATEVDRTGVGGDKGLGFIGATNRLGGDYSECNSKR